MKITNIYNIPEVFVNAVKFFEKKYVDSLGSISCFTTTELIKPPLMRRLEKEFDEKIEVDVTDLLFSVSGQAMHYILEKSATENMITEGRLSIEIDGIKISGQADVYNSNGIIQDYKETSVWKIIFGDFDDWEKQLNIYAYLFQANGFEVKKLEVCTKLKDWSKRKARTEANYPKTQCPVIKLPLWDYAKTEAYIKDRVEKHINAEAAQLNNIAICTEKERWSKKTTYAVMKEGRKSAIKVLDSNEDAENYISDMKNKSGCYIEKRPGENTRCLDYCKVLDFCPYKKDVI